MLVDIWLQLIKAAQYIYFLNHFDYPGFPLRFTPEKIVLNNRIPWPHYDGISIHLLHNLHLHPTVYPCSLNKVFDSVKLISEPPLFFQSSFNDNFLNLNRPFIGWLTLLTGTNRKKFTFNSFTVSKNSRIVTIEDLRYHFHLFLFSGLSVKSIRNNNLKTLLFVFIYPQPVSKLFLNSTEQMKCITDSFAGIETKKKRRTITHDKVWETRSAEFE